MEQIFPLPDAAPGQLLRFSIRDGEVDNEFLRQGPVAAHLLISAGRAPRLLAAFPAGNSATGLWFETDTDPVRWESVQDMRAVSARDKRGRILFGIEATAQAACATLTVRAAVLSSARVLRDYQFDRRLPPNVANTVTVDADRVCWERDRIDGAPGYALSVQVPGGTVGMDAHGRVTLNAAPGQALRLRITALCGETPLQPIYADRLLRDPGAGRERARNSLAFLSYQDKLLAGSWRFNTYFGRDTLMSLLLLMPALTPEVVEAGLGSVLTRLGADGAVAHEEDIGEWALLHGSPDGAPLYDYKMVDDDFMLAPVMAAYLLDQPQGALRAPTFLARRSENGQTYGEALRKNVDLVLQRAAAFGDRPSVATLIRLKPGQVTGDWRDSADGLGGGTISYNVNAVLVPAALRAIAALAGAGLIAQPGAMRQNAASLADAWERHAPSLFQVERDAQSVRRDVASQAEQAGVAPGPALDSLGAEPLRFHAIALNDNGAPVPVLHSDFGFALLLLQPPAAMIDAELAAIMRPYPAGLMTDIGMVVANGTYGDAAQRAMFGRDRYHGAVVWSWQQALLAAGLARQQRRADLPPATRTAIAAAQRRLWKAIDATAAVGNSELWSWTFSDGHYHMQPFGPDSATADESNAVQLWSTVYLALRPPGE